MVQDQDGAVYIGGGLNILAPVQLTQQFPSGFRAIEEQLWKDIVAPYQSFAGGHLYRYDPAKHDAAVRLAEDPCPLEDLGIPVPHNSIYALVLDRKARAIYGITYPDARLFVYDLARRQARDLGPLMTRKIFSGPERTWRSVPRGLCCVGGRVYTSGEDGLVVYYDPATQKIAPTTMRLPGEYWEAWNYYGYPVLEQFVTDRKGRIFGGSSDGFVFQMDLKRGELVNLGKPRVSRRIRAMTLGADDRLYLICGEFQEPCKLYSYDPAGREGFREWGVLAVDRSPYYAKRAYQFDAMTAGIDGTIFIGESDRRANLFLFFPGSPGFPGGMNPSNPR